MARIQRVYVDTSVIGGYFDPEFEIWSKGLFQDFRRGIFAPVVSDVTSAEIGAAPQEVQDLFVELLDLGTEVLPVSEEALLLASYYESRQILPARFRNDMLHIAVATAANADILVSWNFRHIVRFDKIRMFNAVNAEQAYREIAIYSPREVTFYDKEEGDQGG